MEDDDTDTEMVDFSGDVDPNFVRVCCRTLMLIRHSMVDFSGDVDPNFVRVSKFL